MSTSSPHRPHSSFSGQAVGEPYLFLTLDGNQPTSPVSRHRIGNVDEIIIGRGVERLMQRDLHEGKPTLFLRFPDPWMSALHARIQRSAKGVVMTDPGSKNGSFVNGTRLSSAVLTDGDILQFGHTFFIYRAELPATVNEDDDVIADLDAPLGMATMLSPLSQDFISFARAAADEVPMILEGEIGTGKSIMARSAHALSGREGQFTTLNVTDLSDLLFEKKLRGQDQSAGRGGRSVGVIESAAGGTLLLEDIDKLSLRGQALLLRVMNDGAIDAGDGRPPIPWACRLVCTASSSLEEMVSIGRFDPHLLHKINGFRLLLPPLRHRREDIGLLIASMVANYAPTGQVMFSADAAYAILSYMWPRNLRELESCLGTALAWRSSTMVEIAHLPPELRRPAERGQQASGDTIDTVELVQQDLEKRANIIASLRGRSSNVFSNRDSLDQVRSQFKRWLARAEIDFSKKG